MEVGVVGTKGFVGGFPGAEIPDFGEPLLREVYAETSREVEALEGGLEAVAGCERRLVLLHYAPVTETVVGEPEGIWAFLGSGRLAGSDRRAPSRCGVPRTRASRPADGRDRHRPVHNVARHVIDGRLLPCRGCDACGEAATPLARRAVHDACGAIAAARAQTGSRRTGQGAGVLALPRDPVGAPPAARRVLARRGRRATSAGSCDRARRRVVAAGGGRAARREPRADRRLDRAAASR